MSTKCYTLKKHSEMVFHDIENIKDKTLQADSNLERHLTVGQCTEDTDYTSYVIWLSGTASTVHVTLDKFFIGK